MKKIFILFAILALLAGMAYGADLNSLQTAELAALNVSRSRTTDTSVVLKLWCDAGGAANPAIGVSSASTMIVYVDYRTQDGVLITTTDASYDTLGEVVDYINTNLASDSSIKIHAVEGADGYRSMSMKFLVPANYIAMESSRAASTAVVANQSDARITAGAEAEDNVIYRIKDINTQIALAANTHVNVKVYDNGTVVWRKFIGGGTLNSTSAQSASPNSITFGEKGLSISRGHKFCVEAVPSAVSKTGTDDKTNAQISIVYDELRR